MLPLKLNHQYAKLSTIVSGDLNSRKKAKEARKNQHIVETKEVQLTPQIGVHDMETKVRAAIKFLDEGNKVKVGVRFRGRQMAHIEVGQAALDKFIELVSEYAVIEKTSRHGRSMAHRHSCGKEKNRRKPLCQK